MTKRGNPNIREVVGRGAYRREWTLRKEYKIRYDDTWREIMKEVSVELGMDPLFDKGLPYDDVVRINTAFWKWVSEMLARVELVRIRLVYFGIFVPSAKVLRRYCANAALKIETMYRRAARGIEDKGIENVNKMSAHLKVLQGSYFRMMEEEEERKRVKALKEIPPDYVGLAKIRGERRRYLTERMSEARERRKREKGSVVQVRNEKG